MGNTYDPHWITPKFGHCSECGKNLVEQQPEVSAYYFPRTKLIFCVSCGERQERVYMAKKAGEEIIIA